MAMMGGVAPSSAVGFDVVLPLRDKAGLEALVAAQHDPSSASFHHWLTPAEVNARFGADAAAIEAASAQLRASGLSVTAEGRVLHASGPASAVTGALGTPLALGRTATGHTRPFATGVIRFGGAIGAAGGTVLGLDRNVREHRIYSQRVPLPASAIGQPGNRQSAVGVYWYDDLRQAYQYPSYQTMITVNGKKQRLDGTGATIGIVMSSDVLDSDIKMMFNHENFTKNSGQPADPRLYERVPVNGGAAAGGGAFVEASLDVQQSLGGAPGAHVILYSIPDLTDASIIDAYVKVVAQDVTDVVSSSFGACELFYTAAYNNGVDETGQLQLEHEIFLQGNAEGITFLVSSGDDAGRECPTANYVLQGTNGTAIPSVSTPASDPNVTAVGGTNLITASTAGSLDSSYVGENAYGDPEVPADTYGVGATISDLWWGAGGGISTIYAKPAFQNQTGLQTGSTSFRALPDVGMQVGGCPGSEAVQPCNGGNSPLNGNGNTQRSAVVVTEAGQYVGVIGTSVSSPEFSSVVALLVEQYGRMGNLNSYLYSAGHAQTVSGSNSATRSTTVFHRSIPGYNGVVTNNQPVNTGGAYYNYTVGNGTPIVYHLVGAATATPAGAPQTSSNP
ncbi:S53 family peptidase [Lichenicola sp.]|uniref:S53 family peptidase n=1 Tax=Lichenicola sp. TaxID=2804529 RepID=UPI003AFFD383